MIKWFKKLFSKNFIVPIVNERLATAIDDKIKARHKKQEALIDKHQAVLNGYLITYFKHKYANNEEMAIAYIEVNKLWVKYCRDINSTEKLINLNKNAFKTEVDKVLNKIENDNKRE